MIAESIVNNWKIQFDAQSILLYINKLIRKIYFGNVSLFT